MRPGGLVCVGGELQTGGKRQGLMLLCGWLGGAPRFDLLVCRRRVEEYMAKFNEDSRQLKLDLALFRGACWPARRLCWPALLNRALATALSVWTSSQPKQCVCLAHS